MKNQLILFILLLVTTIVRSQVSVTAIQPGPRFTLDDLWNITIVSTNPNLADAWVNVSVTVYDEQVAKIVTSTTKKFQFINTVININKANLRPYQPITVNYAQRSFKNELEKQGGIFPSGSYKVEVSCNSVGNGEYTEPLGKYVYNINAELIMPIQLVSVYNNDTIEQANPMFNWIPPYPLPAGNITYEIKLTEIEPNETALSAMQRNQPQLRADFVNQNSFFYTTGSPQLIKGKEYAWQVIAYTENGNFYSGSETWRFVYDYGEDSLNIDPPFYFLMDRELSSSIVYIDSNLLPLKFPDEYIRLDSIVSITITNDNDEIVGDEADIPLAYGNGSNYTYINMCPDEFELENGLYILEIVLVNQQKYYLRFRKNSLPDACY